MKTNKKFCSVAFVSTALILFLIFVSSAASASPTITETRITTSGSAINPAIYENKVVWEDLNDHQNSDIFMYDLSTKKETQITTSGSASSPAIYKNKIVWNDNRNRSSGIYMYDLSTKKETQITTSKSASSPDIYGNRIVWTQWPK